MLRKQEDKKIICDQYSFKCGTGQSLRRHNYDLKTQGQSEISCRYCLETDMDIRPIFMDTKTVIWTVNPTNVLSVTKIFGYK